MSIESFIRNSFVIKLEIVFLTYFIIASNIYKFSFRIAYMELYKLVFLFLHYFMQFTGQLIKKSNSILKKCVYTHYSSGKVHFMLLQIIYRNFYATMMDI